MPWVSSCYFLPDSAICRRCARCGGVLRVTPADELMCPRCGHVRVWVVNLREHGSILEGLGPAPAREPAGRRRGWSEEN